MLCLSLHCTVSYHYYAGVHRNNAIAEVGSDRVELTFAQFRNWNDDHASRLKRLVYIYMYLRKCTFLLFVKQSICGCWNIVESLYKKTLQIKDIASLSIVVIIPKQCFSVFITCNTVDWEFSLVKHFIY